MSFYLLPSLYISAGGQKFAIPSHIDVVHIATERLPLERVEPEVRIVQLLFQAEQKAGTSLLNCRNGSWLVHPESVVFLKGENADEDQILYPQIRPYDTTDARVLNPGDHQLFLGAEEIRLMIPPPNAVMLHGGNEVYSFVSSFEKTKH